MLREVQHTSLNAAEPFAAERADPGEVIGFDAAGITAAAGDGSAPAAGPIRIVPAAVHPTPRAVFDCRRPQEPAAAFGAERVPFPGGDNGDRTDPQGFAERLRTLL
ncbi:hypothetical protein [Streptomyces sp. 142MFCol3.1]|uniref:hypothetical protein n=1 Tax=Streptomyces sp. 142MFCol3.1 TaxID=1172179 RepID=UPI00042131E5|nr:hypothetical protein [Streptomyces sp. 142MFCol3.1]